MTQETERGRQGNRIASAIANWADKIRRKRDNGELTDADYRRLSRTLDLEWFDYGRFQSLKSEAAATGVLSYEEAQLVYGYLGGSVQTYNAQGLAVKSVLSQLFKELLERQLQIEQLGIDRQRLAAETAAQYVPKVLPIRMPTKRQGLPKMPTKRQG